MVIFRPERIIIDDKHSHDLMFMLVHDEGAFRQLVELWFDSDTERLVDFLTWLDDHDLRIGNKTNK